MALKSFQRLLVKVILELECHPGQNLEILIFSQFALNTLLIYDSLTAVNVARWFPSVHLPTDYGCSFQNSYSAFIQLMPVFIIIVVSVITQLMATNPPYSLFYKS